MAYSASRSSDRLSIIVPRRFDPFLFAFVPLWTIGWVSLALGAYRRGVNESAIISSLLALILFAVGTAFFLYEWLWNIGGREELNFTITSLQHRRVLFGMSRTREFRMNQIAEPRFVESVRRRRSRVPSGLGFEYGREHVRMGDNLTQQEAREIVQLVTNQFPELGTVWGQYSEGFPEPDEFLTLRLK
jgi:hypothetical protein